MQVVRFLFRCIYLFLKSAISTCRFAEHTVQVCANITTLIQKVLKRQKLLQKEKKIK